MRSEASDTQLLNLIELAASGRPEARAALIDHACDRLLRLTRKMFHGYPGLRRWEQTDDVFQNSLIRLHRALAEVQVESVRHFFNLAAVQVRRALLDLSKRHFGPLGFAANHHTDGQPADDAGAAFDEKQGDAPQSPVEWIDFHECVESLAEDEREVVNLLLYEGLTQEEAAKLLGVSLRTVKRRWHEARNRLHQTLGHDG